MLIMCKKKRFNRTRIFQSISRVLDFKQISFWFLIKSGKTHKIYLKNQVELNAVKKILLIHV
jgi:hypothetical protein